MWQRWFILGALCSVLFSGIALVGVSAVPLASGSQTITPISIALPPSTGFEITDPGFGG